MSLPYRHQDLLNYERMLIEEPLTPTHNEARMQLLDTMLADPGWCCDTALRARLEQTLAALRLRHAEAGDGAGSQDNTAWVQLAEETRHYLDYCRLARLEARLRGCAHEELHFTRNDWQAVRLIEAALETHNRQVRDRSYAPEPASMFRVH